MNDFILEYFMIGVLLLSGVFSFFYVLYKRNKKRKKK